MDKAIITDEIDISDAIPFYQIDSLLKNTDHHILPICVYIKDCHTIIETDISGMIPVSLFLVDKKVTRKTAIAILLSYSKALKWCVDHFLNPRCLKCNISEFYVAQSEADICDRNIYFRYTPNIYAKDLSDSIDSLLNQVFNLLMSNEENTPDCSNPIFPCIDSKIVNKYFTDSEIEILSNLSLENIENGIDLIDNFPEIIDVNSKVSPLHNDVIPKSLEERLNSSKLNNNGVSGNPKHKPIGCSFISKFQFTPFVIVSTLVIEFLLILLSFVILRNQNMFTNRYLPVFIVVLILIFCALADMILLLNPKSPIRILSDTKPYPIDAQDCNLFSVTEEKTTLLQRSVDKSRIAMLCNGIPGTPQETLGQKAYVLVDDFLVGRDGVKVDFKINSLSVGRMHARITRRENSFFIEDLDTRNGTYIDDLKIKKKQEYLLPEKCKIRFADQVFYFVAT